MVGPPLGMAQFMAKAAVSGGGIPMPVLAAMAGAAMTGGGAGGGIGGVGGNVGAAPPFNMGGVFASSSYSLNNASEAPKSSKIPNENLPPQLE